MITKERKEEIIDMAASALNSMGSHFFYCEITLATPEEAQYAKHLWPKAEIKEGKPLVVGYRP